MLETIKPDHTAVVFSDYEMSTADFTRNANLKVPGAALRHAIEERAGKASVHHFDAHTAGGEAVRRLHRRQHVPARLCLSAGLRADRLGRPSSRRSSSTAPPSEMSRNAFRFGRLAAHDRAALDRLIGPAATGAAKPQTLEEIIAYRADAADRVPGRGAGRALSPTRGAHRRRRAQPGAGT